MNYWRSFRGSRLSAGRAISSYWSGIAVGSFQLWRNHSFAIDRATVSVSVWEFRTEAVPEIGSSAVAEIESLVLLNEGPLEAVNGVAFEKGFIFCGGEWPARATF